MHFEVRAGRICWWTGRMWGMREASRNRRWSRYGGGGVRGWDAWWILRAISGQLSVISVWRSGERFVLNIQFRDFIVKWVASHDWIRSPQILRKEGVLSCMHQTVCMQMLKAMVPLIQLSPWKLIHSSCDHTILLADPIWKTNSSQPDSYNCTFKFIHL